MFLDRIFEVIMSTPQKVLSYYQGSNNKLKHEMKNNNFNVSLTFHLFSNKNKLLKIKETKIITYSYCVHTFTLVYIYIFSYLS